MLKLQYKGVRNKRLLLTANTLCKEQRRDHDSFIWSGWFLTVFPNTIVLHLLGMKMLMPFKHSDFMMWFNKIWSA